MPEQQTSDDNVTYISWVASENRRVGLGKRSGSFFFFFETGRRVKQAKISVNVDLLLPESRGDEEDT